MRETGPAGGKDGGTAVVVLHWGDKARTLACLRSIARSSLPARPLLVIDNGTGALRREQVEPVAPAAELISLPENLGFAGGCNVAIRRALESGAESVFLLNNDAILDPECLGELVRMSRSTPGIGAVGAKVLSAADPATLWLAYGRLSYGAALVEFVGQGEADGPRFDAARDVEWVPGCAMLLTRAALERVGLFDERFFAYHEDVDWCTAARALGFRIVFAPAARVTHHGEGSLASRGPANPARYLSARNTILFARKHARPWEWLRLGLAIGASLPLELVRRRRPEDRRVLGLLMRGYRDGLLGRELPLRSLGLR